MKSGITYQILLYLYNKAQSEFPERLEKTLFWRACAYSVENKLEKAIQVLKKV
ncbi:hypothetical protein [Pallidibacillus pasinlerensis]|uniref:Uncharacterized protein n=1 Tax=Pallidibacillus pasinlerensis TaxID=2703818 RepID=A0ABX0AC71_9BACI|nr:hypothetical protein [Pallidibacillus pasinlerensis]NCU18773.1 hypothetical protein [Pallidibacillus pasinlerensis]